MGIRVALARVRGRSTSKFQEPVREKIVQLAQSPPRSVNLPVNRWTLHLLAEYAAECGIVSSTISHETVRQILREGEIRIRRTKTWKETKDPDWKAKWKRIRRLYRRCPDQAHVVCFDPFGPLEIRPHQGRVWAHRRHVPRLPATYRRPHGVRYFLAWLDVHQDQMAGILCSSKHAFTIQDAFQQIRASYPHQDRIYIIQDNATNQKTKEIQAWTKANNITLVFTATNASWMNRIECHFEPLREHAIRGSYPENHMILACRIFNYLRWRNAKKRQQQKARLHHGKKVA